MLYENPLYLAEEAAALDLIADGRTALGVSRGAPEIANKGWESFGYRSEERNGADLARAATALRSRGFVVYRADVDGGPAGRWRVNRARHTLSDAELVTLAETRMGFKR